MENEYFNLDNEVYNEDNILEDIISIEDDIKFANTDIYKENKPRRIIIKAKIYEDKD